MTGARWQPARRVARLAAVAAVAAAAPSPGNPSAAIRARYFAHGAAAGADAVDEAVAWLAAQEALAPPRANATAPAFSARDLPGAGGGRVCAVTHGRVAAEGTFERTGGAPPYDWSCWCLKARYHTAPACLGAAAVDRPVRWRWTLRSALAGACATGQGKGATCPASKAPLCRAASTLPPKVAQTSPIFAMVPARRRVASLSSPRDR